MIATDYDIQKVMYKLRCVAEKDPSDVIANAASQLAFELETTGRYGRLTPADRLLIRHSEAKNYTPTKAHIKF